MVRLQYRRYHDANKPRLCYAICRCQGIDDGEHECPALDKIEEFIIDVTPRNKTPTK